MSIPLETTRPITATSINTGTSTSSWRQSFVESEESAKLVRRFNDFKTVDWINESIKENQKHYYQINPNAANVTNQRSIRSRPLSLHNPQFDNSDLESRANTEDFYNLDQMGEYEELEGEDTAALSYFYKKYRFKYWRRFIADRFKVSLQSWITLTLIGLVIGLIAGCLNIITEWLGDIKTGYCSGNLYLNKDFCCYGEEDTCTAWKTWTNIGLFKYLAFITISVLFGFIAAILCLFYSPTAAGSGISEVKCIVSGFILQDGFLGWWTLLIKSIALPLTIASGLSVGKEGPSVHYAACVGNVIPKFLKRFDRSYVNQSQFLTAASAAGVAVAFASPIGGVLFSLEEITSTFKLSTIWKSYYCALIATGVLATINPFRTGQIVMFEVKYESDWKYFEVPFFIILGIFGGVYGIVVSKFNIKAVAFRQKYLKNKGVREVVILCLFTSVIGYFNEFIRLDMTEGMEVLFHECGGEFDHTLCDADNTIPKKMSFLFSLLYATILRMFLVVISYGAKVPCGIFVPSMAAGATFGRAIGLVAEMIFPCSEGSNDCIISGTYAFLGAASALSGITHLTLAVVVIMFELTGATRYIVPTMICVGVTKIINDNFGNGCGGIADQMIKFNGIPFIDVKEEHDFEDYRVEDAMTDTVVALPYVGLTYKDIEELLGNSKFQVFPVIITEDDPVVLGYIERSDLIGYLTKLKREAQGGLDLNRKVRLVTEVRMFSLLDNHTAQPQFMEDLTEINLEPVVKFQFFRVSVNASLNSGLQTFMKLGPRMMIVEDQGKLAGMISRKDLIKFELFLHRLHHGDIFVSATDYVIFQKIWQVLQALDNLVSLGKDKVLLLVGRRRSRVMVIDQDDQI